MGAAFDDAFMEVVAAVISTEGRAFNNNGRAGRDYWTPDINRAYATSVANSGYFR